MPTREEQELQERKRRQAAEAQEKVFDQEDVNKAIELLPGVLAEAKKGVKTTEFWITLALSVLIVLDGVPLPERFEGFVVAGLGAIYAISRGLAKKGVPHVEVEKPKA